MAYGRKQYKRAVAVSEAPSTEGPTMINTMHPHFHGPDNPRTGIISGKYLAFC